MFGPQLYILTWLLLSGLNASFFLDSVLNSLNMHPLIAAAYLYFAMAAAKCAKKRFISAEPVLIFMIKAVIFDWGGVLIKNPDNGIDDYSARRLKAAKENFTAARKKFISDFDRGAVSEKGFWKLVCAELNVNEPKEGPLWRAAFEHAYRENKGVFSLAKTLRRNGYKVGFLSNTEQPAMKFFHEQNYDVFDVTVFSCAEHLIKPEKGIYLLALKRLGVEADEAVFIDDKEKNVEGAKKAGLHATLFKGVEQLRDELNGLSVKFTASF